MQKGFTLVEILIVIAILATLATIGVTQYWGINSRARDSARRQDLYAIATALEVNKNQEGYTPLAQHHFSSSQWADSQGRVYCIGLGSPEDPAGTEWTNSCPSGFVIVAPGGPAASFASWKVCTYLENSPNIFCRSSRQ